MIGINVNQIPNGKWSENCYIVNGVNNVALIIDPGGDEQTIINFINSNNFHPVAIINTHAHYDHVGAISKLKDEFLIPFFLHSKDANLLKNANLYAKVFDGSGLIKIPTVDYYLDQIDIQDYLKDFSIKAIFTPGHTRGSVCIQIEDCLFTGDTLMLGKIGRVDLPGGNFSNLKESLTLISKFSLETFIYPGHGSSSTIGNELKNNKSLIQILL